MVNVAEHAFVYANGLMSDIGVPPGGADIEADAINAAGQVTGPASLSSSDPEQFIQHAFLYSGGVMRAAVTDQNRECATCQAL